MPDERLPMKVFYGDFQAQGDQKKRFKDTLAASLKVFNIPTESCEQATQDRTKWHCFINKGAAQFKAKRICEAERKRKKPESKSQGVIIRLNTVRLTCSICNRQLLNSHQRTHTHT